MQYLRRLQLSKFSPRLLVLILSICAAECLRGVLIQPAHGKSRGIIGQAFWKMRNNLTLETAMWGTMEFLSPSTFDAQIVLYRVMYTGLGIRCFVHWAGDVNSSDSKAAWREVMGSSEVKDFMSKFQGADELTGLENPIELFDQLRSYLQALIEGRAVDESVLLDAVKIFRTSYFSFASKICNALACHDSAVVLDLLNSVWPVARECLHMIVGSIVGAAEVRLAIAKRLLKRWMGKFFALDYRFAMHCPYIPKQVIEDYQALAAGNPPSGALGITFTRRLQPPCENAVPSYQKGTVDTLYERAKDVDTEKNYADILSIKPLSPF